MAGERSNFMDSMYIMDPTIQVGKPKSFMDSARNAFSSAENTASSAENSVLTDFSTGPSLMQRVEGAPSNLLHKAEGMSWYKIGMYGMLLLILSVLGFNIFNYLGKVTQTLSDIFGPIISLFGGGATSVLKKTVSASAVGTGGIIKGGADAIDSGLGALENKLNESSAKNNIDNKKVNTKKTEEENAPPPTTKGPIPDEAGSNTQSKPSKPSFCYIGEDRGTRSCIQVDKDSNCMSGEIFPSMELCINPALRS